MYIDIQTQGERAREQIETAARAHQPSHHSSNTLGESIVKVLGVITGFFILLAALATQNPAAILVAVPIALVTSVVILKFASQISGLIVVIARNIPSKRKHLVAKNVNVVPKPVVWGKGLRRREVNNGPTSFPNIQGHDGKMHVAFGGGHDTSGGAHQTDPGTPLYAPPPPKRQKPKVDVHSMRHSVKSTSPDDGRPKKNVAFGSRKSTRG